MPTYDSNGALGINALVITPIVSVVTKGADYTATLVDQVIICTATLTISLPAAATATGQRLTIKSVAASSTITIDPQGAETIDGQDTAIIRNQYTSVDIVCDGTGWNIV